MPDCIIFVQDILIIQSIAKKYRNRTGAPLVSHDR